MTSTYTYIHLYTEREEEEEGKRKIPDSAAAMDNGPCLEAPKMPSLADEKQNEIRANVVLLELTGLSTAGYPQK